MKNPFVAGDPKRQQFRPQDESARKHWNQGNAVSRQTLATGRRIAGALRAEQARQQKRRDSR